MIWRRPSLLVESHSSSHEPQLWHDPCVLRRRATPPRVGAPTPRGLGQHARGAVAAGNALAARQRRDTRGRGADGRGPRDRSSVKLIIDPHSRPARQRQVGQHYGLRQRPVDVIGARGMGPLAGQRTAVAVSIKVRRATACSVSSAHPHRSTRATTPRPRGSAHPSRAWGDHVYSVSSAFPPPWPVFLGAGASWPPPKIHLV